MHACMLCSFSCYTTNPVLGPKQLQPVPGAGRCAAHSTMFCEMQTHYLTCLLERPAGAYGELQPEPYSRKLLQAAASASAGGGAAAAAGSGGGGSAAAAAASAAAGASSAAAAAAAAAGKRFRFTDLNVWNVGCVGRRTC